MGEQPDSEASTSVQLPPSFGKTEHMDTAEGKAVRLLSAALAAIGILFALYCLLETVECLNTGISAVVQCPLPNPSEKLPVYRLRSLNKEESLSLGNQIAEASGAKYDVISYGKDHSFFADTAADGGSHLLAVSNKDGTYTYSVKDPSPEDWCSVSRNEIEQAIALYGLTVPASAVFTVEGNGWHRFTVDGFRDENSFITGTIRCRYAAGGHVKALENSILIYHLYGYETSRSAKDALRDLEKNRFSGDKEEQKNRRIYISNAEIGYIPTEDGLCEPYYFYTVIQQGSMESEVIMLPAFIREE